MPEFTCPHCGNLIEADPAPEAQIIDCPHCMQPIELPAADDLGREDELDAARIHRISQARRADAHASAYCLIGSLVCLGVALQLIYLAVRSFRATGLDLYVIVYSLLVPFAALLAIRLWTKSR